MEQTAERTRFADELSDESTYTYRPISSLAVLALVCGLISLLTMTFPEELGWVGYGVLPAFGVLLGFNAIRSVRRYDSAGMGLARTGLVFSAVALVGGYGLLAYAVATEVPEGAIAIDYERLQPGPAEAIPAKAQELDGKKVFIKGYVYPGNEMTGITKFILCRDKGTCCFGGQPKTTDMIEVTLKEPLSLSYNTSLRHVAGTFTVKPDQTFNGLGGVLYHLEADYLR